MIALLVSAGVFVLASQYFSELEMRRVEARVSLYQSTLVSALDRFQHLPFVLSQDQVVREGAAGRNINILNERLASFAERSKLDAIYLMDPTGLTVAASNFNETGSFVNQSYDFRPYFQDAISGTSGAFFGIGSTTGLPGYFVSEPVRNDRQEIIGVIAIKLSLAPLVSAWAEGGEAVFTSNSDGVIALSSEPEWLYQTLTPLTVNQRDNIRERRQFAGQALNVLDWYDDGKGGATINDIRYLHAMLPAGHLGWNLHYVAKPGRVIERAALSAILSGLILTVLLTYAMAARSQRIQDALATSQEARKALQKAHTQLLDTQNTLARTSKLAALGQLAASVTHELGQPITALRNYIAVAEIDSDPPVLAHQAGRIVSRMENITQQLKFFATPGDDTHEEVDLRDVVRGALMLTQPDFDTENVLLDIDLPEHPVMVTGTRLRLEQVLINLLRNARLAAIDGSKIPYVSISMWKEDGQGHLSVRDSGNGFEGEEAALFEPFKTSRPSGEGMGLGLSISYSITKDHGGALKAFNHTDGGAVFTLSFPLSDKVNV